MYTSVRKKCKFFVNYDKWLVQSRNIYFEVAKSPTTAVSKTLSMNYTWVVHYLDLTSELTAFPGFELSE